MKINHAFTVHAPIDRAWEVLTDVEAIAPCMPGAQLLGVTPAGPDSPEGHGDAYEGKVKVKMGPVVAEYKGTAVFISKDDVTHVGVIDAKGRDTRGAGNASATITVSLTEVDEGTKVAIDTDLKISGKIAQFGAGMIQEVSEKLLGQFVSCLEGKLDPSAVPEPEPEPVNATVGSTTHGAQGSPAASAAAGSAAAGSAAEPAPRTFQPMPEPEALDLFDLAGNAAAKRLVPVAIAGAVALAAVIIYLSKR